MNERKMRPESLASTADVSLSKLRRWFNGEGEPSYREMLRIAAALDKPLRWFVDGTDDDALADQHGKLIDADIRRLLLAQKKQRLRELEEIDALLGI